MFCCGRTGSKIISPEIFCLRRLALASLSQLQSILAYGSKSLKIARSPFLAPSLQECIEQTGNSFLACKKSIYNVCNQISVTVLHTSNDKVSQNFSSRDWNKYAKWVYSGSFQLLFRCKYQPLDKNMHPLSHSKM